MDSSDVHDDPSRVSVDLQLDILKAKAMLHTYSKQEKINSWSCEQEVLLREWAEKSAGYRWLHLRTHELYNTYNNYLAYPIIFLSCIGGIGGLSLISDEKPTPIELYIQYIFFSCNILITMLSSIQRFNSFIELSEKHSQSSILYSKFYRNISMELSLDYSERELGIVFCKQCKQEFDRLLSSSPEIPSKIINLFNEKFPHVKNKPDIANGLTHLKLSDDCCHSSGTLEIVA